ncbi:MAG: TetR/AcrR family transcriptional regulator [Clostridiales bacterium]|nr:TetR/AcrR family transcriptional regulator [Clostridiales bacterium]
MDLSQNVTREKIIRATISFIEKYGIHSVTIRGIAKEADVNSAAINYYFRSKENLLEETLKLTIKNFQDDYYAIAQKQYQNPGELLQAILFYLLAGSTRYPGITKAHLYESFVNNDHTNFSSRLFKKLLNLLVDKISELDMEKDKNDIRMSVTQLISAVLMPSLFSGLFKDSVGLDLKDENAQKKYVSNLINHYYHVDKGLESWHPGPMDQ